ncbi:MAG: ABC transporter permease [Firmicutes bacterium]|nr:ABC transporter permease [Bacillota bacterium]
MSLVEIFRAVFINIWASKFKVFLTTLGIIVGSVTIILVIGIGKGGQEDVAEQFRNLNATSIFVMPALGKTTQATLGLSDVEAIKEGAPSLSDVTIMVSGKADASYRNTSYSAGVTGATEEFCNIQNLTVKYGAFISHYDNERRKKVAVIGDEIAELFYGDEKSEAVGTDLVIKGRRYEVIGVLERVGDSMQGFSPDEGVIVPYEAAEKYILGRTRPRIMALAKDVDHVASAIEEITEVLNKTYQGKSDAFMIRDAGSRVTAAQDSARTMSVLLIAVATIVLIVGGIGIMNVLFVSVKERTKEIGILKAIGARRKDILLQFLIEAIVISTSGGLIGILLSIFVMPLMQYFDLRVIPSLYGYVMALAFSIATGTFFGYYPASKAATLRPIEALNYE